MKRGAVNIIRGASVAVAAGMALTVAAPSASAAGLGSTGTIGAAGSIGVAGSIGEVGDGPGYVAAEPAPGTFAIGSENGSDPDWETLRYVEGPMNGKYSRTLGVKTGQYEMLSRDTSDRNQRWNIVPNAADATVTMHSVSMQKCVTASNSKKIRGPQYCASPGSDTYKRQVFTVIPSNTDYHNGARGQGFVFKNAYTGTCLSMSNSREKRPFRGCENAPAPHEVQYFRDADVRAALMTIARTYAMNSCSRQDSQTCVWLNPRTLEENKQQVNQCFLKGPDYLYNGGTIAAQRTFISERSTGWSQSFGGSFSRSIEIGIPLVGKVESSVELHADTVWSGTSTQAEEITHTVPPQQYGWMTLTKQSVPMEGIYRFAGLGMPWEAEATIYIPVNSGTGIAVYNAPNFPGCDSLPAPTVTELPRIDGTMTVGETVHATNGAWSTDGSGTPYTPDTYQYQWLRGAAGNLDPENLVLIGAATGPHYTIREADRGTMLVARVVAIKPGHIDGVADSEMTGPVG